MKFTLILCCLLLMAFNQIAMGASENDPSWVRAGRMKNISEKYEILQTATDHKIVLPKKEENEKNNYGQGLYLLSWIKYPKEEEAITLKKLEDILIDAAYSYRRSLGSFSRGERSNQELLKDGLNMIPEMFMALYRASRKIFPDDINHYTF